ncbi:hypothetical protein GCM10009412_06710 [Aeromonas salmonicida subsp. achromogenes]
MGRTFIMSNLPSFEMLITPSFGCFSSNRDLQHSGSIFKFNNNMKDFVKVC